LLRFSLGDLCLKAGDTDAAMAHLGRALELDPQYSAAWKLYGRALVQAGRREDAMSAYDQGIAVADARGDIQAAKEMRVFRKRLDTSD
jgi:Flp pilus assembly protein TadD